MDPKRVERVERLRHAVAAGTYRVDSLTIADRLLDRWDLEELDRL